MKGDRLWPLAPPKRLPCVLHQSGVEPTAEAAIRAGDAQRRILLGPGTATPYRVTAPADPVLVHGNRSGGAKGPRRSLFIAVWKSDLFGSDIDPLHGVFGERAANRGWGRGFWGTWHGAAITRSAPEKTSPVTDPKRTEKLDQRHRQGKREIMGLMAVAVTVSQDRI